MSRQINASLLIPGKHPAEVWPLLSDASQLTDWFCEYAQVELHSGLFQFWGRYTPDAPGPDCAHISSVRSAAPAAGEQSGRLEFDWLLRGQLTSVCIELGSVDAGTEVRVVHRALGERLNNKGAVHDFWYAALENLRLCALTGRPQQLVEYGAVPGSSVTVEVVVAAPPEAIFRCLIEPEWMARLWNDKNIHVEPVVGGVYNYGWKEGGPRRILALDPPRLLSFSWLYPPETKESTVTWRLESLGNGRTRLSLSHDGLQSGEEHEEYHAGWFSFLVIIKGICELEGRWSRVQITGSPHGEA